MGGMGCRMREDEHLDDSKDAVEADAWYGFREALIASREVTRNNEHGAEIIGEGPVREKGRCA